MTKSPFTLTEEPLADAKRDSCIIFCQYLINSRLPCGDLEGAYIFWEWRGRSDRGNNTSKASVWLEVNMVGTAHQVNVLGAEVDLSIEVVSWRASCAD